MHNQRCKVDDTWLEDLTVQIAVRMGLIVRPYTRSPYHHHLHNLGEGHHDVASECHM